MQYFFSQKKIILYYSKLYKVVINICNVTIGLDVMKMKYFLSRFFKNNSGASGVEYTLISGLIGFGAITGVSQFGSGLDNYYCQASQTIEGFMNQGVGRTCVVISSMNGNFNPDVMPQNSRPFTTIGQNRSEGLGTEIADGWVVTSGDVDVKTDTWRHVGNMAEGEYSIDMVGVRNAVISKTIDTVPGQQYTVTFDYSKAAYHNRDRSMSVDVGGQNSQIFSVDGAENYRASQTDYSWNAGSYSFTATDTQSTINIASVQGDRNTGIYLKNVNIGY